MNKQSPLSREVLIALHETEGVGWLTIERIANYAKQLPGGNLNNASEYGVGDWREIGLSARQAAAVVASLQPQTVERRTVRHAKSGISFVSYWDEHYPPLLRETAAPPWIIYYKGNWQLALQPSIAIVGARVATAYGRHVAEELSGACAERLTVVSGLARGIDTAAHLGALRKACGTIAVLATPVDRIYPPENKLLYRDIGMNGLLLSESPPDTALRQGLFPLRNRIIAGLALGVLVVEAAEGSGALITARRALDYNRDVFVVPGQITSPRSWGALLYFREGAIPVLDATDVFRHYKHILPELPNQTTVRSVRSTPDADSSILTPDETSVYNILLDQPRSIEELAAESGMTFGLLHSVLLSLLIKRRIHQQPGSVYNVL
jgi:DNA processing protein